MSDVCLDVRLRNTATLNYLVEGSYWFFYRILFYSNKSVAYLNTVVNLPELAIHDKCVHSRTLTLLGASRLEKQRG